MTVLPPGQRRVNGFPRFGTHPHRPPPAAPAHPTISVSGAVRAPFTVALTGLDDFPAVEHAADFHCVAGWSATGLRWEGVSFAAFYKVMVEPVVTSGVTVTHLAFEGLDGFRSILELDDALADDVLIATRLNGRPLTPAHGAPVRLVSPSQYGYMSTKHLRAIEVHTARPRDDRPYAVITRSHPRARVWKEERHPWFPAALLRPLHRLIVRML